MRHTDSDIVEKKESLTEFLTEIAGRLLTSLLFWGAMILLAVSAYTDIAKIGGASTRWSRRTESGIPADVQTVQAGGRMRKEHQTAPAGGRMRKERQTAPAGGRMRKEHQTAPAGGRMRKEHQTVQAGSGLRKDNQTASAGGGLRKENQTAQAGNDTGECAWSDGERERRQIALTFDDGPHPKYTKLLLDGLAQRGVVATFFVVGKNIPSNEALISRMEQEGHLIGNHTYDHVKISDLSAEQACEQVERTSALVREITGKDTEFIRPPFGAWNKGMECSFTMIPVLLSIDPLDWTTQNTALIKERILKEAQEGDIILMHDYYQSSVDAALDVVDALLAQGYEFVTVDRLILE